MREEGKHNPILAKFLFVNFDALLAEETSFIFIAGKGPLPHLV